MVYVSLIVEFLRAYPGRVAAFAIAAQATVWALVPIVFYAGPPGDLPFVMAIGREFQLGTAAGPPLAFWAAEIAFRMAGNNLFGVYLLAQVCVAAGIWAVFLLGRAVVGGRQAALAVLLMVGISAFTVPTPEFNVAIMTLPLWAFSLLYFWRALVEDHRRSWYRLAFTLALLLMTTWAAMVLIGLMVAFVLASERGRAALETVGLWACALIVTAALFPHLIWLELSGGAAAPVFARMAAPATSTGNLFGWFGQFGWILAAHAGVLILLVLAGAISRSDAGNVPAIVRTPLGAFARRFVFFFALVPVAAATLFTVLIERSSLLGGVAPLSVLSGLAVIVLAGDSIRVRRQTVTAYGWFALLLVPAASVAAAPLVLPWVAMGDIQTAIPAGEIGRYYGETFERRTGRKLEIVAGEPRTAALVALGAPSRPSVFNDAAPRGTPWVTWADVATKGAIVVWPTNIVNVRPLPTVAQRYPDVVAEVRAFERPVQGLLPLLRYGWMLVRPKRE